MSIGNVNLITAALDLELVRLLRGAMARKSGVGGAGAGSLLGPSECAATLPRRRVEPRPIIEPRKRIEPTPRFEPRPVIHPQPRVEPLPACEPPHEPESSVRTKSPVEPPWKVLAWEIPVRPAPVLKLTIHRPDFVSKGSLLDFFI